MCVAHLTNLQQQNDILALNLKRWHFFNSVHLVPEICDTLLTLQKRLTICNLIEDSTKAGRFVLFFWGPFVEGHLEVYIFTLFLYRF